MKLVKIFDIVNQIEKSSFFKLLDSFCDLIKTSEGMCIPDGGAKSVNDAYVIKELFDKLSGLYQDDLSLRIEFDPQLLLLVNIIVRDGNAVLERNWLEQLYKNEHRKLAEDIKRIRDIAPDNPRFRDYKIFRACVSEAYNNDERANRECQVTRDEKSILNVLAREFEFSHVEALTLYASETPIPLLDIDNLIGLIKDSGIGFYSKKNLKIYIPDEVISLLQKILKIDLPNKYFRRILKQLQASQLNRLMRKYNIGISADSKADNEEKIRNILIAGIDVKNALLYDIYPDGTSKTEVKDFLLKIMQQLNIDLQKIGSSPEERLELIIQYFKTVNAQDNIDMSIDAFENFINDINIIIPEMHERVRNEFELYSEDVMSFEVLTDYNIKPRDLTYLMTEIELAKFCEEKQISLRGNIVKNILSKYGDIESRLLENYLLIAARDINALKTNNINVRESELGSKFEYLTKEIFSKLKFNVDDKLRAEINTNKDKIDIVISLGNNRVIIVECKTSKDVEYNKYSSLSRQLKSYQRVCKDKNYQVVRTILVAPDFSKDFVDECIKDWELELSLVTADGLMEMLKIFNEKKMQEFPIGAFGNNLKLDADKARSILER
ncbi:MAG: hypothetical protein PHE87_09170 [Victivallaceae bacterium]|nr:hypothetical protein [Victivallaceae bacterium]